MINNEKVVFRLLQMPCCKIQICWVNPRLPTHCPECGTLVYMDLKTKPELTQIKDENAWLKYRS